MNRSVWPNVTTAAGSYCHGQPYIQQRKMADSLPSTYGQFYQNQAQWLKPYTSAESVNQDCLEDIKYSPETSPCGYFQNGRIEQSLWKQTQQMKTSNKVEKCMCSCTSGVPQCTCWSLKQQEKVKPSLEQNQLQWLGGLTIGAQQDQLEPSNPHQSFTVPSSTYKYPYFPGYSESVECRQKQACAARDVLLPNNIPLSSMLVKPSPFSTCEQIPKSISSPPYDSTEVQVNTCSHDQFPKVERSSLRQCRSSHSNPPNSRSRRKRPRLCHFILELLADPEQYSNIVEWVDQENGVFKFVNSSAVASQWGKRRDKPNMKYENFARSLRTYIAKGIMTKPRSRLVYRFTKQVL